MTTLNPADSTIYARAGDGRGGAVPTNVPTALSSFVGRVREVAAVRELLGGTRLLTVVGPGGAGKTRLAREVAAELAARPPEAPDLADGVWWVELAPVAATVGSAGEGAPGSESVGRDGVVGALAAALGVRSESGRAPVDAVSAAIGARPMLVVLDNCEHVVGEAAALAEGLLRACPRLTLLATSREALAVEGEVAWAAPPLAWPPAPVSGVDGTGAGPVGAAAVGGFDAVRLFVERARAAQPGFGLTDANAGAVAAICARLDGVPLALELAAPHVATLGVYQLAARLADALALLDRGRRTGPARHRTLRALLDWSYQLLAPPEQRLLCRLSVLQGPVALDAVVAVCGHGLVAHETPTGDAANDGPPDDVATVTLLGRLVEQSLVDVRDADGEVRYRLLETVRQYGAERLAGTPDEGATRVRHACWMGDVADVLGEETGSAGRGRAMVRFYPLIDDARAALAWSTGPHGRPVDAMRIAGGLAIFWHWAGLWTEGRAWADASVRAADASAANRGVGEDLGRALVERFALARALQTGLLLAWMLGDPRATLDRAARALPLWASVEADPGADAAFRRRAAQWEAYTREFAAFAHLALGDPDAAVPSADAAVEAAVRSGNGWARGLALGMRAMLAPAVGRPADAARDLVRAEAELRAVGDTWVLSWCYANAAAAALAQGDPAGAAAHARAGVATLRPEPDWHYVSRGLDALAAAGAAWLASPAAARRAPAAREAVAWTVATLLGAAAGVRDRSGTAVWAFDAEAHAATVAAVRAVLTPGDFDARWADGHARPSAAAFDLAASAEVTPDAPDGAAPDVPAPNAASLGATVPHPGAPDAPVTEVATPDAGAAGPPRAAMLRVLTLGSLIVERDGAPLGDQLPGGKVTELLLYFVCHPAGRTREQIGLALWPDASAAQLRNQFHVTLHALRRALGDVRWVTHADGAYRLERAVAAGGPALALDCDVDAVLAAADALRRGARRGELPDADALDAARTAFERARGDLGEGFVAGDWLVEQQERVASAWVDGMAVVGHALAAAGRSAEAAAAYEAILARDPFREAAHRALMACYAQAGEPARALAHYEALTARLARELNARPAAETQTLAARLRGR